MTVSGPDTGSECAFPFPYQGTTYISCAPSTQAGGWCKTDAGDSDDGVMWGHCDEGCRPNITLSQDQCRQQQGGEPKSKNRNNIQFIVRPVHVRGHLHGVSP